ncbi:MAG: hypothetical protein LBG66_01265 [Gallionellaceae bacterium]|jgi:hypothetical protein|nr:hypothetical protein [Gallionellaceae bacterium]
MKAIATFTAAATCALVLSACGGGSSPSADGAVALQYEAVPVAMDRFNNAQTGPAYFLGLVNQEGAKGYRYLTQYSSNPDTQDDRYLIFIKDDMAPSYIYDGFSMNSDPTLFASQIVEEGANGYLLDSSMLGGNPDNFYSIYRKNAGSPASYTYAIDTTPTSMDDFITQANEHGKSGYRYFYTPVFPLPPSIFSSSLNGDNQNLYVKDTSSNATYTYDALTPTASLTDFIAQANSEGAKGYRYRGVISMGIGSENTKAIYMKDESQSATFTYESDTEKPLDNSNYYSSVNVFVGALNNFGARGYAFYGYWTFISITPERPSTRAPIYFKASDCSGYLCSSLNSVTQN